MSELQNPLVRRYLDQFRNGLSGVDQGERDELVREIESHIAEATGAGESLAQVLERLGPAERLARAYSAELLLRPGAGGSRVVRWFAVAGVLAVTSLPSFVVISVLSALGFGLAAGGILAVVGGFVNFISPGVVQSTLPWPAPLESVVSIVVGLLLVALGLGTLLLLRGYFRFVIRTIRRVLSD